MKQAIKKRLDALDQRRRGRARIFIAYSGYDDIPPRYRLDQQELPESTWLALVAQARPTDYVIRVKYWTWPHDTCHPWEEIASQRAAIVLHSFVTPHPHRWAFA
jgi:hypothetical protein